MIAEELPVALDGERLDRVVSLLADVSRSAAAELIAAGAVRVDEAVATSGKMRLARGSRVAIDTAALPRSRPPGPDPDVQFDVVHADGAVVVVDKPPGLVVHPGAGHPDGTLVNGLLARFPEIAAVGEPDRPGIVHRLDAGSSGLLVVARNADAAASLSRQFADHSATRRYIALAWGAPDAAHGIVEAPIGRDPGDPTRMAVVVEGRPARTEYEVVERFDAGRLSSPPRPGGDVALLSCRLETGRTHQIRVHLAAIGHPLVGDQVYGPGRPTLELTRPFLHAAELSFVHPSSGEPVTFESGLPADLAELLERLRGG